MAIILIILGAAIIGCGIFCASQRMPSKPILSRLPVGALVVFVVWLIGQVTAGTSLAEDQQKRHVLPKVATVAEQPGQTANKIEASRQALRTNSEDANKEEPFTYYEKDFGFKFSSDVTCENLKGVDLIYDSKKILTSSYACGKGSQEYTSISASMPLEKKFVWANEEMLISFSEHSVSMYSPVDVKSVKTSFRGRKSIIKTFTTYLGMQTFISQRYVVLSERNVIMSLMAVSYKSTLDAEKKRDLLEARVVIE